MTWNPDVPQVGNNVSADIPDIKENLNELMLGMINRPKFTYNGGSSAATIKISGGYYCCKDKFCYWASELTSAQAASGTPTADTWYYFYLDYSAITSGTAITNSELIWSTTAPSWNHTYRGWYNGDDRCIFACLANSAGDNFLEFFHNGDYVQYAGYSADVSAGLPSNNWTDGTITMPGFCVKADLSFNLVYSDVTCYVACRTNGQTDTTGHIVNSVNSSSANTWGSIIAITDSSQKIEYKLSAASVATAVNIYTNGWYFSEGM